MDALLPSLSDNLETDYAEVERQIGLRSTPSQKEGARRALAALDAVKRASDPEAAKEIVARLLDPLTTNENLPPLIGRLLENYCRSYLERLYIAVGEQDPEWRNAFECIEKLVWSVQPKLDQESRKQLFALIPDLFQWIHALFEAQEMDPGEEDAVFAELAQLHADALSTPLHPVMAASPAGDADPSVATAAGTSLSHRDSTDPALDIANPDPQPVQPPRTGPLSSEEIGNSDLLAKMHIGALVEFAGKRRASKRVMRLKWMSGQGSVFLFQDPHTDNTLFVTAARLDQRFRERSAFAL